MNPCPCGYYGDPTKECNCSSSQILTYQKRLSGPLLDRIDLTIGLSRVPNDVLLTAKTKHKQQHLDAVSNISRVKDIQNNRYKSSSIYNGSLTSSHVHKLLTPAPEARQLLTTAGERLGLSARSFFKIIKVAQTIADLDGVSSIEKQHIAEALQYRHQTS